jgi:hypothetical protein
MTAAFLIGLVSRRAAQRPRAKLPGGSGQTLPMIVAQAGGPEAPPYGLARRVSFSELLDSIQMTSAGRRSAILWTKE